jgi:hypothetical protein
LKFIAGFLFSFPPFPSPPLLSSPLLSSPLLSSLFFFPLLFLLLSLLPLPLSPLPAGLRLFLPYFSHHYRLYSSETGSQKSFLHEVA